MTSRPCFRRRAIRPFGIIELPLHDQVELAVNMRSDVLPPAFFVEPTT
jgi:hypothetical protein